MSMKGNSITKRAFSMMMVVVLLLTGVWVTPQEVNAKEYTDSDRIITNDIQVGDILSTDTQVGTNTNMDITYQVVTMLGNTYDVKFTIGAAGNYYKVGYDYQGSWFEITSKYKKWRIVSFDTTGTTYKLVLAPYVFTVSYDLAGTTIAPVEVTPNEVMAAPSVSVEAGYIVKWYKDSSYKTEWDFSKDVVTGNMTLYGRKEAANSTAKFVDTLTTGTASDMPESQTIAAGGTVTSPSKTPTRTGYTFNGWYADSSCKTEYDFSKTCAAGNNITIYAGWTANTYKVAFDTKGGNCNTKEKECTYASAYGELPQPTRTGYEFGGWYADEAFNAKVTAGTDVTTAENHTLYAKWTPYNYTIKFDANSGSGSMNTMSVAYDEVKNLEYNLFTKADHTFIGWNTRADGTGTTYTNGQEVKNLSAVDGDVIVLYAQWGEKTAITAENLKQNLSFSLDAKSYDGSAQEVSVTPQPGLNLGTITVKYYDEDGNEVPQAKLKNAGTYTVKVSITEGADNKATNDLVIGTFTIEKRKVTLKAADKESVYGEAIETLTASITGSTGLVSEDDLGTISAKCNVTSASPVGTYTIIPTYTENPNYDVTVVNGTYKIMKKPQAAPASSGFAVEGVSFYNETRDTADGSITGVTDAMEYRKEGETEYTSVGSGADAIKGLSAGVYYIRFKEKANEAVSADTRVTVTKNTEDVTAPEITIKQSENVLNKILTTITFGQFFKDTTKFDFAATDEGVGVDESKYAYYLDENPGTAPMSELEMAGLSWTIGKKVSVNPEKRFVLYVKAEDALGNTSYAYTDGIHVVKTDEFVSVKDEKEWKAALEAGFEKIRIDADIEVPENTVITVPEGVKIIVSQDVTVKNNGTWNGAGTILNNGTIVNNKTITGDITIINNGKFINNGTVDTKGSIANSADATQSGNGTNTANYVETIKYDATTQEQSITKDIIIQLGNGSISMKIDSLDKNGNTTGNLVTGLAVSQVEKIINGCFTEEEKAAVKNGQDVKLKMTVKRLENSVSSNEKTAMEKASKTLQKDGYAVEMTDYFDVCLEKQIGTSDWTKITNLSNEIDITMNIPTAYQKEGRVFYIVRNHDGKCEVLSDSDKDAKTITFSTDRFSTYALGYTEAVSDDTGKGDGNKTTDTDGTKDNTTGNSTSDGNNVAGSNTVNGTATDGTATSDADKNSTAKTVQTGDSTMPRRWIFLLFAGGCILFATGKRYKKVK